MIGHHDARVLVVNHPRWIDFDPLSQFDARQASSFAGLAKIKPESAFARVDWIFSHIRTLAGASGDPSGYTIIHLTCITERHMAFAFKQVPMQKQSKPTLKERRLAALEIRKTLLKLNITTRDIADHCLMTLESTRNVLNCSAASVVTRQRITNYVGMELWPGMKPHRSMYGEDGALLEQTLAKGREIFRKRVRSVDEIQEQADALYALVTPELLEAVERVKAHLPLTVVHDYCEIFGPLSATIFGVRFDAVHPRRVKLGAASTKN